MRWKSRLITTPHSGSLRYVRRFALWPVRLEGGTTIWLERYWQQQRGAYTSMDGGWWENWGAYKEQPDDTWERPS